MKPFLSVQHLAKNYHSSSFSFFSQRRSVSILKNLSFDLEQGKVLGVIGESGCGKSTLAKILVNLEQASGGHCYLKGQSLFGLPKLERCQSIQMVFQDPYSSLNPYHRILPSVAEAGRLLRGYSKEQSQDLAYHYLTKVGLPPSTFLRYPQTLSGGQRQRVNLARAFLIRPDILILDEPLAALDVSIQAQVLNLLYDLKAEYSPTIIFISHDLETVEFFCDQVMIMYFGEIVEQGSTEQIFENPHHPYTQKLLQSSPSLHRPFDWNAHKLSGEVPSFFRPPQGCAFHSRCPNRQDQCLQQSPMLSTDDHRVACFFPKI
jgi:oligopeptide/dipeptide ABC transporter ATP-binding protein